MLTEDNEEKAIAALAAGASLAEAAEAGSMSPRSLRRRQHQPDFSARLNVRREVISREIDASLRALARQAVLVLTRTMQPDRPPNLQLRAAIASLQMWARTRDFELEDRVAQVEAIFAEQAATMRNLVAAIELMKCAGQREHPALHRGGPTVTGSSARRRDLTRRLDDLVASATVIQDFNGLEADVLAPRPMYSHGIAGPTQFEQLFPEQLEEIRQGLLPAALTLRSQRDTHVHPRTPQEWAAPLGEDPVLPWITASSRTRIYHLTPRMRSRTWCAASTDYWRKKGLRAIAVLGSLDGMRMRQRFRTYFDERLDAPK